MSKIEWCDKTWNPITGCTPISEGCEHCYAQRMFTRKLWGYDFTPNTRHFRRYNEPSKWKKGCRVFVCSMGDLFHDYYSFSDQAWIVSTAINMRRHTFMLLTKRAGNMAAFFRWWSDMMPWPLPQNLWVGVTAENQQRADERIPHLLSIPAAVRFVSIEPMLGPVDILPYMAVNDADGPPAPSPDEYGLQWVIAGAETGPGKRAMSPRWAFSVRDQCRSAGTPFFFKKDSEGSGKLFHVEHREFPTS